MNLVNGAGRRNPRSMLSKICQREVSSTWSKKLLARIMSIPRPASRLRRRFVSFISSDQESFPAEREQIEDQQTAPVGVFPFGTLEHQPFAGLVGHLKE